MVHAQEERVTAALSNVLEVLDDVTKTTATNLVGKEGGEGRGEGRGEEGRLNDIEYIYNEIHTKKNSHELVLYYYAGA